MSDPNSISGPNFLCIGAQKAGTSWLHVNLRQHPSLWLPPVKEIHYFNGLPNLPQVRDTLNEHLKTVLRRNWTVDRPYLEYLRKYVLDHPKDDAWYRSLFADANGMISGDITPAYSTLDAAAVERVHRLLPDARIMFIMRSPIDRAWSHVRLKVSRKRIDLRRGEIDGLVQFLDGPASELRTRYMRTIGIWESFYPPSQIKHLFFEEVGADPSRILQSVCEFLGVDFASSYFERTLHVVVNRSVELACPPAIKRHLAAKYHAEIVDLERRFGGYACQWLAECNAILA